MKNKWIVSIIALLVLIGGVFYIYRKNITSEETPSLTLTYPNGGEDITYFEVYTEGDLYFNWTTSEKENYTPSKSFKAYVIDESGKIVISEPASAKPAMNLGDGKFRSSFSDPSALEIDRKYKIKVCDILKTKEYCDVSDNYFILSGSPQRLQQ